MIKNFYVLALCIFCLGISRPLFSQIPDSTFDVVTYHSAAIPEGLGDSPLDRTIKDLGKNLPADLESEIRGMPHGIIRFLNRAWLGEFKLLVRKENISVLVDTIVKAAPKPFDAILFMGIDIVSLDRIKIRAEIVDLTYTVRAGEDVDVFTKYLNDADTLKSKMRYLARGIIKDFYPWPIIKTPRNWFVSPSIPLGIKNWKVSLLTASSVVATVGTYLWYHSEKDMAEKHYAAYQAAETTQDAVAERISAEKANSRSAVAETVFWTSVGISAVLLANDILFQSKSQTSEASLDNKVLENFGHNVHLTFNQMSQDRAISLAITMKF